MASTMVSASTGAMNSLLGKLAALMGEEYGKIKGVRKEVKSLEEEFSSMKALLEKLADLDELDAPAKQWRNQVKDMSYDIEDCIDDFVHRIGNTSDDAAAGLVKKTARLLKKLRARHQLATQIQEIKARVREVDERRKRYNLDSCMVIPIPSQSTIVPVDPRVVAMHTEAAHLVGMDVPRDDLVKLLMGEKQDIKVKVASIVGFGGLGKTTLANQVYHKLEGQFQCKVFVSVSQRPNIPKLLNKILHEICGHYSHTGELDDLIKRIKEHLQDKRYLIIIDDLWDSSVWKIIRCAFPENNLGSRVLTTTRIYDVALICCSSITQYVYNMRPLGKENSRRLFFNRIFGSSEACPGTFEEHSADILKKCGGLPLAIISIASLLAGQSKSKWEYVRNSLGSMFEGNPNLEDMMEILNLSYKSLPHHLKTCLLYVGMYPEDQTIKKDDLLRQWIAEGFVRNVHGIDVEDVAGGYFNELINMSMIQPVETDYNDEVLSFRVHDIMLDLVRVKSADENFICVIDDMQARLQNNARRVSVHHVDACQMPTTPSGSMSQLRSFMVLAQQINIMPLLEGFKYVRVMHLKFLRFWGHDKVDLTGICGLFLLRYLKIEGNTLDLELPNQLWDLQCLETMDLKAGRGNITIPSDIARLQRLSHLIVPSGTKFQGGIGSLKSLRTLKVFDISCNPLDITKSLGKLTNLVDLELCFDGNRGSDSGPALRSSLERLADSSSNLRSITLREPIRSLDPCDLFNWYPYPIFPGKLQNLQLGPRFSTIPRWIADLHGLCSLDLSVEKVTKTDSIATLAGLPSLVYLRLRISVVQQERIVIPSTSVAFPILKRMVLVSREPLVAFEAGALPRIQNIQLTLTAAGWEHVLKWLGPAGIEHLPSSLQHIRVECLKGRVHKITESSLRSTFTTHHPGVHLSLSG